MPAISAQPSPTAPAANPPRWRGRKTAIAAALAIGLSSGGAVAAAAAVDQGATGSDRPGPGGQGFPGGGELPGGGQPGQMASVPGCDSTRTSPPWVRTTAATHPDRVTRVATMVSMAPCDAPGLEWTDGMMPGNRASSRPALTGREALAVHLAKAQAGVEPGGNLLPQAEQEVLARPEVQEMIATAYAEALRPGIDGWVDDVMALYGLPWGFDPADISVPVMLWHGGTDTVVPAAHTAWLAERIPGAVLVIEPTAGHAGHFDATPDVLGWLLETPHR